MPSKATLNEKMSDIIGETSFNINENIKISNNFLLDQNLENFNKNQIELGIIYPSTNFNLSYLEESNILETQNISRLKLGLILIMV